MPSAQNAGASVSFELHGDRGEVVMLVPGLGLPGSAWGSVVDLLHGRGYKVMAVDPRGSGASDKPDAPYTAELVANDLRAVLEAANIESAHVVGLSMGGMIAQDFALRFPALARSLVLLSTFAAPDAWFTRLFHARRDLIERIGIIEHFRIYLMFVFSPMAFRTIPDTIARVEQALHERPPAEKAYLRQIDYCLSHDSTSELGRVSVPTRVISGTHDFLIPAALGKELASLIPGAEYVEVEGASHALWLESPDTLVELIDGLIHDRRAGTN
jgi:pimeloyl-ACP methyl ester carboxylesterase